MLKIKLEGVKEEFASINKQISKTDVRPSVKAIISDLEKITPVDTGFARDSWESKGNVIVNTAPYIENLNAGSSKQAPSFFIEKTCLKHGIAVGTIVEIDPDA